MNIALLILWYIAAFAAGVFVFRMLARTMLRSGHVRLNFMGREIPTSLGVGFVLLALLMLLAAVLMQEAAGEGASQMALLVCGFCVLGLLDDVVQVRESGGFRGHLARAGAEGRISTALIKALFGLVLTLLVAATYWRSQGWLMVFVNVFIVVLSANSVNLLDVRPGRAVKGFLAATLFIFAGSVIGDLLGGRAGILPVTWFLIGPFLLWALSYAKIDLTCRGMMGDAGSNVLGAVVGLLIVWELSAPMRWVSLGLLIGFHLFCEAVSLTQFIERVPPLKWLDSVGLKPNGDPLK